MLELGRWAMTSRAIRPRNRARWEPAVGRCASGMRSEGADDVGAKALGVLPFTTVTARPAPDGGRWAGRRGFVIEVVVLEKMLLT